MKNLLVVVDYQRDFVTGSLGFPGAVAISPMICEKIRAYQAAGDDIVATLDTHGENYSETQEGRLLPVPHCLEGSEGWQLCEELEQLLGEVPCFRKKTFGSVELADYLREHPYDRIELVGVVSSICVISNAVIAKAAQPEAEIVIDANCTAGADPDLHEKALDVMQGLQMIVLNRSAK